MIDSMGVLNHPSMLREMIPEAKKKRRKAGIMENPTKKRTSLLLN